jgi:glycosyltransferase involved in cell wall biosynthesis
MSVSIAALTGGTEVASARFRVRQYIQPLQASGVCIREFGTPFGAFPPAAKWLRPVWGACSVLSIIPALLRSYQFDAVLFQRELLSTLVTLEPLSKRPRILDVDDAIWHFMGDRRARRLARMMECIICGNQFLADYFSGLGARVAVIPTAVDVHRFHPNPNHDRSTVVIGWSGPSGAFGELAKIEGPLATVLKRHREARFHILADRKPQLPQLPSDQVIFTKWSPAVEVGAMQSMDIGIMPLSDSIWNRGKCSYKMLLYMACGRPVVVSPIGMNVEVLARGQFGFAAVSDQDWMERLEELIANEELRTTYGLRSRQIVNEQFSVDAVAPMLGQILIGIKS